MKGYYEQNLSAQRLKKCYEIALPRVRQYFEAELSHVLEKIAPGDTVLDLGCGYGRTLPHLAQKAGMVAGVDNSYQSLNLARESTEGISNCVLAAMNAVQMGFSENKFDVVICIQNGISAFHVDQKELIKESIRVAKPNGKILFSSYSEKFWDHRLEWFQMQADEGLLGEIDREKTGNGVIICKDGFKATTVGADRFSALTSGLGAAVKITEVDASSLFCEITPP
ncbi:MAG: class I SAM-dependent methyltransferase [bacterium]|nr:class I SAM-dependent methyltransferase [bacterium]